MRWPAAIAVTLLGLTALLTACDAVEEEAQDQAEEMRANTAAAPSDDATASPAPPVEPARCPAGLAGCRTAAGVILYVEAVDPDGDGDAHFVLASGEGITSPGISVIDVRRDLRPDPLPGEGDRISAAGPVHRGSYGQRQIEAVVVHTAYTEPR